MTKGIFIGANRVNKNPIALSPIFYESIEPLDFKDFGKPKPVVVLTKEQLDAMFAKESDKKGLKYE